MRFLITFLLITVMVGAVDIDFNHPAQGDAFSTWYEYVRTNEIYSLKMDHSITASNKPTGTMAFDKTNDYLKQWNGSAWVAYTLNFEGNVGIGTATPPSNLGIYETGSGDVLTFWQNDTTGNTASDGSYIGISGGEHMLIANGEATNTLFYNNGNLVMFFNSSGNVSIGDDTPASTLEVNGSLGITENMTQTADKQISTSKIIAPSSSGLSLFEDSGAGVFVENGGNVGIGTVAPGSLFEIESGAATILTIDSTVNTQYDSITFRLGGTNGGYFQQFGQGYATAARASNIEIYNDIATGEITFHTDSATPDMTITAGGNAVFAGDVYTVAWTDYSGSTIVGWSDPPGTAHLVYTKKLGNMVWVQFNISGTSDDATTSFTLPYTSVNNGTPFGNTIYDGVDNGTGFAGGRCSLPANSTTVTIDKGAGGGTFTASGAKSIVGQFWYEAQ